MEAEATEYMLKEEVETYLMENDLDCKSINPVVFLENRHLSLRYAPVVEKYYRKYKKERSLWDCWTSLKPVNTKRVRRIEKVKNVY